MSDAKKKTASQQYFYENKHETLIDYLLNCKQIDCTTSQKSASGLVECDL